MPKRNYRNPAPRKPVEDYFLDHEDAWLLVGALFLVAATLIVIQ